MTGLQAGSQAAGDAETHNPATPARDRGVKRRRRAPPVADDRNTPGDLGLEGEARDRYDRLKMPDSPHVTEATEHAFPVVIRRSRPHAAVRKVGPNTGKMLLGSRLLGLEESRGGLICLIPRPGLCDRAIAVRRKVPIMRLHATAAGRARKGRLSSVPTRP